MRAALIINPTSGLSTLATTEGTPEDHEKIILAALHTHGIETKVMYTTPEEYGARLAAQAAAEQAEIVIAAGGDGTVHEVASGVIGTQSTLGIIPLGTMNNLARSLNIPETIEEACVAIATGEIISIDIGKINEHCFLEVAGIGLEAALFPAAEEFKSPGVLSTLRGIIDGLRVLLAYQPTRLRISIDEQRRRPYHAIQVTICNSRYYGAKFELVPDAVMDDGLMDAVIYKNFSKLEYLRHAFAIVHGKRLYQPKVIHRRFKTMRITADSPIEIQADGLSHGYTPATVTVLPGALRVCVPVGTTFPLASEATRNSSESNSPQLTVGT
jgi:YegS/Rv2252/BmrU family lipid kinase